MEDCLPLPDDSFMVKGRKALKYIKAEKHIAEIQPTLDTYKSTSLLYFSRLTAMAGSDPSLTAAGAVPRFTRCLRWVWTTSLVMLDRIEKYFEDGAMVLVLIGMGGASP